MTPTERASLTCAAVAANASANQHDRVVSLYVLDRALGRAGSDHETSHALAAYADRLEADSLLADSLL